MAKYQTTTARVLTDPKPVDPKPVDPKSTDPKRINPKHVSALGLDLGAKRIGVAGCDRTGLIASGLTTLHCKNCKSFESVIDSLRQLVAERDVDLLVVGLPYTLDGEVGKQAKKIQKQARKLSQALNLPIEFVDERLTSFAAEQMMIENRQSLTKEKALIDRKAAAIILQQWLDERKIAEGDNFAHPS
ncbi:MAG: putative holliday junction resolvase [Phormidesmis priestleyi Ana]|uniref:Putative pre-16S rRNA nuclease n=1 Tax=Phormidesmis priestleyi Ana TaxID=1666911 RepID=A0A0P8DH50_9CYAN|nr:MAG: putative holliday junction resolvase [Phormidesmis priestleyi Ana]